MIESIPDEARAKFSLLTLFRNRSRSRRDLPATLKSILRPAGN